MSAKTKLSISTVIRELEDVSKNLQAIRSLTSANLSDSDKDVIRKAMGVKHNIEIEMIANSTTHMLLQYQEMLKSILNNTSVNWPPDFTTENTGG